MSPFPETGFSSNPARCDGGKVIRRPCFGRSQRPPFRAAPQSPYLGYEPLSTPRRCMGGLFRDDGRHHQAPRVSCRTNRVTTPPSQPRRTTANGSTPTRARSPMASTAPVRPRAAGLAQDEGPRPTGTGPGVIAALDGLILTGSLAVGEAADIRATTAEGRKLSARPAEDDPDTDFVLVLPTIPKPFRPPRRGSRGSIGGTGRRGIGRTVGRR